MRYSAGYVEKQHRAQKKKNLYLLSQPRIHAATYASRYIILTKKTMHPKTYNIMVVVVVAATKYTQCVCVLARG